MSWTRLCKNPNNLAEDLRANSETTIKKVDNQLHLLLAVG